MRTVVESEAGFQAAVIDLFRLHGFRCYHTHDARRSEAGFPDLVCVHREHGIVFAELKRETGRLSAAQRGWLADLTAAQGAPVTVGLWRPSDWETLVAVAQGGGA